MKRMILPLLLAALQTSLAFAGTYQEKTYFAGRATGSYPAAEQALSEAHRFERGNKKASHINGIAFYQESLNKEALGKYFNFVPNGLNSFQVGSAAAATTELDAGYLIHDEANPDSLVKGTITFKPQQKVYGMRLAYHQDLGTPIKGLFVRAAVPVVHIENNVRMEIADEASIAAGGLKEFFAGAINVPFSATESNAQAPLAKGKINGKRTAAGVADVTLGLGYRLADNKDARLEMRADLILPTGNRPTAEYLFEPIYGNGHHLGLGAGLDASVRFWESDKGTIIGQAAVNYQYLFEGSEMRLPGIKHAGSKFNHYALVSKIGAESQAIPAANILAQSFEIKPGSQADMGLSLNFLNKKFSVNAGYNLFWKDAESVHAKNNKVQGYRVVAKDTDLVNPVDGANLVSQDVATLMDITTVKNPAQMTHSFGGGLGYTLMVTEKYPLTLGLGGNYQYTPDNSALEHYTLWVKAGISF